MFAAIEVCEDLLVLDHFRGQDELQVGVWGPEAVREDTDAQLHGEVGIVAGRVL